MFDVGILTVDLLGVVDEGDPNTRYWINIDFFVHEPQSTSAFYLRHNFLDYHSLYVHVVWLPIISSFVRACIIRMAS